jgi:DNA (cytosine-5)-methyltransferase 1
VIDPVALELFAGSGWGVALKQLGIPAEGVETMPEAIETRKWAGMSTVLDAEGKGVSVADLPDSFGLGYSLHIGGPPCQTFSAAGKGEGRANLHRVLAGIDEVARGVRFRPGDGDPRTWLVLEPLRLALAGRPTFIVWEQVSAVLPVWEACAAVLRRAHGYSTWTGKIRSEQYGVPQTRERAFLIARLGGRPAAPPAPTHSRYWERSPSRLDDGVLPWVSMAEALGFTADMRSNYGVDVDPVVRGHRSSDQPSFAVTSKIDRNKWVQRRNSGPGARRTPRPVQSPSFTIRAQGSGSHPSGTEWEWTVSRPATTVQADQRIAAPGHKDRAGGEPQFGPTSIRVTVEEAAALQSFPPEHRFAGTQGKRYLQVGNAVPPLLAKAILETFLPC